jgi:aminoglycoside phosphotransferase (APT) family kinase protein
VSFSPTLTESKGAHVLDRDSLASVLRSEMGVGSLDAIQQFQGGQSNPTYLLSTNLGKYVLRKKPPGRLLPSAHLVEREYRILRALEKTPVPVPRVHFLCEDAEIIGTPFFVMDFVPGRIIKNAADAALDADERWEIFKAMNAALTSLHQVDPRLVGLGDFGKWGDYASRQIKRWSRQYESSRTEDIPAMDFLGQWLLTHLPSDDETTLVHGDFRLDNLVIHEKEPRVLAVLDWELSTLGHPKSDLAYNCLAYHLPGGHPVFQGLDGLDLENLGIPLETDQVTEYGERMGRDDLDDLPFYLALSLFRLAAIVQGVYARSLQGNASSENAAQIGATAKWLAEKGQQIAEGFSRIKVRR